MNAEHLTDAIIEVMEQCCGNKCEKTMLKHEIFDLINEYVSNTYTLRVRPRQKKENK